MSEAKPGDITISELFDLIDRWWKATPEQKERVLKELRQAKEKPVDSRANA